MVRLLNGVLPEQPRKHSSADAQQSQPRRGGSKAGDVARRILLGPEPGRVDGRSIADGIDKGDGNGTLSCGLRNDIRDPGLDKGGASVDGAKGKDGEDVLGHTALDSGDGDEEDAAEGGEATDKLPLALVFIREPAAYNYVD